MLPSRREIIAGLFGTLSTAAIVKDPQHSSGTADFYVAPNGNDFWSGKLPRPNRSRTDGPFATIERARDAVRGVRAAATLERPVTTRVSAGEYYFEHPLTFDVNDSGTPESPTVYEAEPGQTVLLSGGRRITGRWHTDDNKVFFIDVPDAQSGGWRFRQLFVDGKREIEARYPKLAPDDDAASWLYAGENGDRYTLHVELTRIKDSWANDPNARVNVVAFSQWFNEIVEIAAIDGKAGIIRLRGRECQGQIRKDNPFFVSGVKEELSAAREWYLDTVHGRLYYVPEGGDPNGKKIIAPKLDKVIHFRGNSAGIERVHDVVLRGFTIQHAAETPDQLSVRTQSNGAVVMESAVRCAVENCTISNVDGYGIWLHLDSRENRLLGNEIHDTGAGGILLTGARFSYMDPDDVFDSRPEVANFAPTRNEITRNSIHHCGKVHYYNSGIHLDSRPESMAQGAGNIITLNHVHHMARNGIFAFRHQGGNIIAYNWIHDVLQQTRDGGGIHFAVTNQIAAPNLIKNNILHDVLARNLRPGGYDRVLGFGIYLDWWTSQTRIEGNLVYNTARAGVLLNGGRSVEILNNVIANDTHALVGFFNCSDDMSGNTLLRNVLYSAAGAEKVIDINAWGFGTARDKEMEEQMEAQPSSFVISDYNLTFVNGSSSGAEKSWQLWTAHGMDSHSHMADPLFVDPAAGNFRLRSDTEVAALGIHPLTFRVGPDAPAYETFNIESMARQAMLIRWDDTDRVRRTGKWIAGNDPLNLGGGVFRESFLHDDNTDKGQKEVRFTFYVPESGRYAIYLRWTSGADRASNVPILIRHGKQEINYVIDQQRHGFMPMLTTTLELRKSAPIEVTISNAGTNGLVIAEAVAAVQS